MSRGRRRRRVVDDARGHRVTLSIAWVPSVVGLVVSVYLFGLDLFGGSAVCLGASGCDAVRSSVFGRILGVPVSAVGTLFFGAALVLCWMRSTWRDQPLRYLAAAGAGTAVVFVVLQFVVIRAICPYCLVAELAAFALAYLVLKGVPPAERLRAGLVTVVAAGALLATYAMAPPPQARPGYGFDLARHLAESGDVFYGAYWCGHCREQKALFGSAAALLPYVECDPRGKNPQSARCQARGIRAYPTWEFQRQLVEGVLTLEDLARRSGFPRSPGW